MKCNSISAFYYLRVEKYVFMVFPIPKIDNCKCVRIRQSKLFSKPVYTFTVSLPIIC